MRETQPQSGAAVARCDAYTLKILADLERDLTRFARRQRFSPSACHAIRDALSATRREFCELRTAN